MKTRTSRRIDLDANTLHVLEHWRHRLVSEGATIEPSTPMFLNTHHRAHQRAADLLGALPRLL